MKLQALCRRTTWEIVRDPLNLAFGLGFPLVLLLLLSAIQTNVPVDLFAIDRLTPGISVFGLAFIALFSATLVARDRESALLQRLYTAPLTAGDFIFGYVLPLVPMAAVQAAVCYLAAVPLGLTVSVRMLWAVLLDLPAALLFIGLGLLCGSVMNVKQVGSICGALLTNLTAWLSGTWFDLELVGGAFQRIAYALPFVHAVELNRAALSGDWASVMPHLWWVLAYAAAALAAAVLLTAAGESEIYDSLFANRFACAAGFAAMGAACTVRGRQLTLPGGAVLHGTDVTAPDLRGGAALLAAALAADGETRLRDPGHIPRGYENLPAALRGLGAEIS